MEYVVKIKSNRIKWDRFGEAATRWAQLKADGDYIVLIKRFNNRTSKQNRTYWKRCEQLSEKTGYTRREISNMVMDMCGFTREVRIKDRVRIEIMSTAELSVEDHCRLYDAQDELAHDVNDGLPPEACVVLIEPGERNTNKYLTI